MTRFHAFTASAAILLASVVAPSLAQEHDGHGEHAADTGTPQMTMAECRAMHERRMGDAESPDEAMAEMDEETRIRMQACHTMMHADGAMDGHHGNGAAHSGHNGNDDTPQAGHHDHHG
jgi:peroxiredoxin family protein